MKILLFGAPGVGKTTIICRLARALRGRFRVGGFFTEEIRGGDGRREGFRVETFLGAEKAVLAHRAARGLAPRVGRYGVDVPGFEALLEQAFAPAERVDVYLIDEIGKMECFSEKFVRAVEAAFRSGCPVVATVAKKGAGFIAEVKARPDVELREVTPANREDLPERLLAALEAALGGPAKEGRSR
jgi:nucleoside-triphosphatase